MTIEIRRDRYGIAHVRADAAVDAFFGQGYAAGQDRLWHIEMDRRKAAGRWAEVVGASGVAVDSFTRRLGVAAAARRDYEALSDATREMVDAYSRGINAWIDRVATTGATLPTEFGLTGVTPEPHEPWQCLGAYKVRHLWMGTFHRKLWRTGLLHEHGPELLARIEDAPRSERVIVPVGAELDVAAMMADQLEHGMEALAAIPDADGASNNWAVHGSRTETGAPLVAGDPHRVIDLPNVYWQNQITCDEFDVIGLSFPGVPAFPHFAHNTDVAWCITHGMADDQDLFVEPLVDRPGGPNAVDHRVRTETIAVRDTAAEPGSGAHTTVEVEVVETDHGGVVLGGTADGVGISVRWTGLAEVDTTFEALRPMLSTTTVAGLRDAVAPWVIPCNSLVMGDRAGSIAYHLRGRLAERHDANGWFAVPGWDDAYDWTGWVDESRHPSIIDPDTGFVVTANNRIAAEPYVSHDYAGPSRARRIERLLTALDQASVDDMKAIHGDVISVPAFAFAQRLAGIEVAVGVAQDLQQRLAKWDGSIDVESTEACVYHVTRWGLISRIVDELGIAAPSLGLPGVAVDPATHHRSLTGAAMRVFDAEGDAWDGALRDAFEASIVWLNERFGPDPATWRWGSLHKTAMYHPLARDLPDVADRLTVPSVESGGDNETVRAAWVYPGLVGDYRVPAGSVARYVFDLSDWDRSGWVVPHGVAGETTAPHFADQLQHWAAVDLIPMWYSEAAIQDAMSSSEMIEP